MGELCAELEDLIEKWRIPKNILGIINKIQARGSVPITKFMFRPDEHLDINHAREIYTNYCFAKKFGGEMKWCIDDISSQCPITPQMEFFGLNIGTTTRTVEHLATFASYAITLIHNAKAYVDLTPADLLQSERSKCITNSYSKNSIETNLELWDKMTSGEITSGVLRLRLSMMHPSAAMRDPTIYYASLMGAHPHKDFILPIIDHIEGITLVYRNATLSHCDVQYVAILDALGLEKPEMITCGNILIEGVPTEKGQIKKLIAKGELEGWSDIKLFTIEALKRRGLRPEALLELITGLGFTKGAIYIIQTKLWSINHRAIDAISDRFTFVSNKNAIKFSTDMEPTTIAILKNTKNIERGTRELCRDAIIYMSTNDITNLACNHVALINFDNDYQCNNNIFYIDRVNNGLTRSENVDKKMLALWLAAEHTISAMLIMIGGNVTDGLIESVARNIKRGEHIQLFKLGYFICDKEWCDSYSKIILIEC